MARELFEAVIFFPTRWIRLRALVLVCAGSQSLAQDASEFLPTTVVTADRLPSLSRSEPISVTAISSEDLRSAPQLRLDDILRSAAPGFSLLRRSSSRVANPTAQGVSLRNIGPNGAGRTLVLLDGIPLNDPFAGWVAWSRIPPSGIGRVILNPGGGAGLFGNAALGGTIFLTRPDLDKSGGEVRGTIGDRGTFGAALDARFSNEKMNLSTSVDRFESGGYPVLQMDQRGPVDTKSDAKSWLWNGHLGWNPDRDTRVSFDASAFEEGRNNGTRLTQNFSAGQDFSVTLDRRIPDFAATLRLQGYLQRREFRSTFSSVNPSRTVESPALDQFDVPSIALGGSAVWSQSVFDSHQITAGADVRWIDGETNENFLPVGNRFTRYRNAAGRQIFIGSFVEDSWAISDSVKIIAGGRIDYWRQYDGRRVERNRATGAAVRNDSFPEQDGVSPNGRLGISLQLSPTVNAHGAGYTGFRVPTLNELYRPFRVGNDITEANASLKPERLFGGEIGIAWEPAKQFRLSTTAYYNKLHNAVGNITIGEGPGIFSPGGFVPSGGVVRQRRNIDRVEVLGVESKAIWQFAPEWEARFEYLWSHPIIASASESRTLEGKILAQSPRHVAVAAIEWNPGKWKTVAQLRYVGRQFEDDLNRLTLADFVSVDLALGYEFNGHLSGTVRVENAFGTEFEVGKTAGGLVSIGAPRLVSLTMAYRF